MRAMSIPAQVKYIALSLLCIVATVNLVRTTTSIIQSSKRYDGLKNRVSELEDEKSRLMKEVSYQKSVEYVEQEARNKLNMVREGEEIYVVPAVKVLGVSTSLQSEYRKAGTNNPALWLELFF